MCCLGTLLFEIQMNRMDSNSDESLKRSFNCTDALEDLRKAWPQENNCKSMEQSLYGAVLSPHALRDNLRAQQTQRHKLDLQKQ